MIAWKGRTRCLHMQNEMGVKLIIIISIIIITGIIISIIIISVMQYTIITL